MQVITDSASCNKQTTDTFAYPAPLNAIPVFGSIVQRENMYIVSNFFFVFVCFSSFLDYS